MACKTHHPRRCSECHYINRDTYRGAGKIVCYELQSINDRKIAVQVSESQKACNNFRVKIKPERAG
jgi:hypothetical protein